MSKKILVIEDESLIRDIISDILTVQEYDYRMARNGLEGLKVAREYEPDLIICDIMMPELDGYGVLLELQKHPTLAKIPFIFLTAKTSRTNLRKGMSMGADDYLTKPFSTDELIRAIENRLEKFERVYGAAAREIDEVRYFINAALPHELRTPLSSIMGYLDLTLDMFETLDKSELRDMLLRMNQSTQRLHSLVERYILNAQLVTTRHDKEARSLLLEMAECENAGDVIRETARRRVLAMNRWHDLELAVEDSPLAIFPENLRRIVDELVDNALKFSMAGDPISVAGWIANGDYCLEIADQGRGMTEEQIQRIAINRQFERRKYEQQGLGLGLSIVSQIVELYDGQLDITSDPDRGTTVSVYLPLLD